MKQRKKYASIGELVKIVTPKEFVRCGYPLTIKDVMEQQFEEIEKDCARMFAVLENKTLPPEPEPILLGDFEVGTLTLSFMEGSSMSATVHGMLCSAIAAYRLEQQNFGGGTRIIVEKDGPFETGQLWTVTKKSLVKTGKRIPSWGGQDSRTGEWDYEPGGLENEQTHCVYSVEYGSFKVKAKILAANCELVQRV